MIVAFVVGLVALGGTFYAGARYGRNLEARALGIAIGTLARIRNDYAGVASHISASTAPALARVKRFL